MLSAEKVILSVSIRELSSIEGLVKFEVCPDPCSGVEIKTLPRIRTTDIPTPNPLLSLLVLFIGFLSIFSFNFCDLNMSFAPYPTYSVGML
jgi:hypothetical protein